MSDARGKAIVCGNGHLLSGDFERNQGDISKFCPKCGEATLTSCKNCQTPIPGDSLYVDWNGNLMPEEQILHPSGFCGECGNQFPWTASALQAAQELIEGFHLEGEEKKDLKASVHELVRDTPKTQVAVVQFKKLIAKAGAASGRLLQTVLVNVVTEAVKKQIF